jgi:hypothetical protein
VIQNLDNGMFLPEKIEPQANNLVAKCESMAIWCTPAIAKGVRRSKSTWKDTPVSCTWIIEIVLLLSAYEVHTVARPGANYLCFKPCTMIRSLVKKFLQGSKAETQSSSSLAHKHDLWPHVRVVMQPIRAPEAFAFDQSMPLLADKFALHGIITRESEQDLLGRHTHRG